MLRLAANFTFQLEVIGSCWIILKRCQTDEFQCAKQPTYEVNPTQCECFPSLSKQKRSAIVRHSTCLQLFHLSWGVVNDGQQQVLPPWKRGAHLPCVRTNPPAFLHKATELRKHPSARTVVGARNLHLQYFWTANMPPPKLSVASSLPHATRRTGYLGGQASDGQCSQLLDT